MYLIHNQKASAKRDPVMDQSPTTTKTECHGEF